MGQNKAVLKLDSQTKGARIDSSGDRTLYGVYQVRLQPDVTVGAVTSIMVSGLLRSQVAAAAAAAAVGRQHWLYDP